MLASDAKVRVHWFPGVASTYAMATILILALLIGIIVPFYADAMGYKLSRLLVLPAFLLFGFLLLFNRILLLTLIILFRSAGDVFLDTTRFSIGGYETGVGGVINLCVILLACILVLEKPGLLPKKMVTAWLPFLLVALLALFISPDKGDAIRTYLTFLSYFAMFVCAFYFVRSAQEFRRCVKLVLWSSVLPALYALVDIVLHHGAGGEGFRLQSTFTHPNIFAFYLMLIIPLTLYLIKDKTAPLSGGWRLVLTLYLLYSLGLLVLTQTRSAWLACLLMFVAYALLFERRYLVYLLLLPIVGLLIPEIRDRLLDLGTGTEAVRYAKLNSFAWRLSIWKSGLAWMQASHYLFGYGLEAFRHYSLIFFAGSDGRNWDAHNVYVQWFFDAGIIGLFAYLWLYARLMTVLRSLAQSNRLLSFISVTLIIIYLVISSSDNVLSYLVFNWYFWFVLGAACVAVTRAAPAKTDAAPAIRSLVQMSRQI